MCEGSSVYRAVESNSPKQNKFFRDGDRGKEVCDSAIGKKVDGFWTFYEKNIKYVFRSKKPPVIGADFAFSGITLYVPKGSKEAYEWAVGETNYNYGNPVTIYER